MKLEFSLTSKVNPSAEMKLGIDCSAEELSVIISDPVYQALGMKLAQEVSFKRERNDINQARPNRGNQQPNDRVDALRKVVETEHKCQAHHNEAVDKAISNLQDHVSKMLDRIVKDIRSKS